MNQATNIPFSKSIEIYVSSITYYYDSEATMLEVIFMKRTMFLGDIYDKYFSLIQKQV